MKDEELIPFTREKYDRIKKGAEERGYTVVTKYRKGLKHIRLGDIVLEESNDQ